MIAQLSANELRVLEARYQMRDSEGCLSETPDVMFRRVAQAVAAAEEQLWPPSSTLSGSSHSRRGSAQCH